jgi:hypothetical protein
MGPMGGMGDKGPAMGTGGLPWAGAQNYGYGSPMPSQQSGGMMDRKGKYPGTGSKLSIVAKISGKFKRISDTRYPVDRLHRISCRI